MMTLMVTFYYINDDIDGYLVTLLHQNNRMISSLVAAINFFYSTFNVVYHIQGLPYTRKFLRYVYFTFVQFVRIFHSFKFHGLLNVSTLSSVHTATEIRVVK